MASATLENIVGTILVRDHYRWVRAQYIARLLAAAMAVLLVSVGATFWLAAKPPQFRYILTEPSGQMLAMVPLSQPNMSDEDLKLWAVDAVTRLYTFDFLNYKRQFQRAQNDVTVFGWEMFEKAMVDSGNFNAIIANKFVTTAVPTGPAEIVEKTMMDAGNGEMRYLWRVRFPMSITYRSSKSTTSQDLSLEMTIARVPEFINPSGVQLRQIIAR